MIRSPLVALALCSLALLCPPGARADDDDDAPKEPARERRDDPVANELLSQVSEIHRRVRDLPREEAREDLEHGVALLSQVIEDHADADVWGVATYNLGVFLGMLGRDEEAIAAYERLIASDVDDRDPTSNIMSPFRNYRHNAWWNIIGCEERLGRKARAVVACFAMREAYVSHCGTCHMHNEERFRKRLIPIVNALYGDRASDLPDEEAFFEMAREAGSGEALLLGLAKRHLDRSEDALARAVLGAIVRELPDAAETTEARELLGRTRPEKKLY